MRSSRAWPCIAVLVLLLPMALAEDGFRASSFEAFGATAISGDVEGLLLVADALEFSWDATAARAHLLREHADIPAAVRHPLMPGSYLYAAQTDWQREETEFSDVAIGPRGVSPGGALVARSDGAQVQGLAQGLVSVRSVRDPLLAQGPPPTSENERGDTGEIVEQVDGQFLEVALEEGTLTLRGDLILILYGPAYLLQSAEGEYAGRTGEYETRDAVVAAQAKQERHTLALDDAVLQVHAPEGATLLSMFPLLDIQGSFHAEDATGALSLAGVTLVPGDDGRVAYEGAAALQLGAAGGLVAASAPWTVATTGAAVDQGPPLLPLTAAAIAVLVAAGAGAALLWRRRARPEDDLEAALLAMNERRWDDALTPLARVAKARPHDAGVLVDRALCLEQVGRFPEAARGFEAALRAAPQHAEAHFYYARTLAKMHETEAARVHLEAALERDPRLVEMARGESVLRGL